MTPISYAKRPLSPRCRSSSAAIWSASPRSWATASAWPNPASFTAEPSQSSSTESEAYRALERTVRSVLPDALVAPYLVVVVTDARYYANLTDNVFRFLPIRLGPRDLERMHGIDERIGIQAYENAIRTYRRLMVAAAGPVQAHRPRG